MLGGTVVREWLELESCLLLELRRLGWSRATGVRKKKIWYFHLMLCLKILRLAVVIIELRTFYVRYRIAYCRLSGSQADHAGFFAWFIDATTVDVLSVKTDLRWACFIFIDLIFPHAVGKLRKLMLKFHICKIDCPTSMTLLPIRLIPYLSALKWITSSFSILMFIITLLVPQTSLSTIDLLAEFSLVFTRAFKNARWNQTTASRFVILDSTLYILSRISM